MDSKVLKLDNVSIIKYVNKEHIYHADIGSFYLVCNSLVPIYPGRHVAVISTGTVPNEASYWENIADAAKAINVTRPAIRYGLKTLNHSFKNHNIVIPPKGGF